MATGSDLRDLLGDDGARGSGGLDAAAVIRRAKRRRLPRQVALGGAAALAVIAIAVPAVFVSQTLLRSTASSGSAASAPDPQSAPQKDAGGQEGTLGRGDQPASGGAGGAVGSCTSPDPAPAANGLQVTVALPAPDAGAAAVDGTVTIANTGTTTVSGWIDSSPTIVLRRDGRTSAIAVGALPAAATRIDLAPGQSLAYPVTVPLVGCESGHPPLTAGTYSASASLRFGTAAPGVGTSDSAAEDVVIGGVAAPLTVG